MKNHIILFSLLFFPAFLQAQSIVYPKNNQLLSDTSITIQWNEYSEASKYQLQIATDSLFQNIILDSSQLAKSSLTVYLSYGTYFSRVKPLPLSSSPSFPFSSS